MAIADYRDYLGLMSAAGQTPTGFLRTSYDAGADVLYVSFTDKTVATDS